MKVYVITAGSYSGYHIVRVFLRRRKAEAFAREYDKRLRCSGDGAMIEVYNTSDPIPARGLWFYDVSMMRDGRLADAVAEDSPSYGEPRMTPHGVFLVSVMARDRQHAIKIGNEKRAQYIAEEKP